MFLFTEDLLFHNISGLLFLAHLNFIQEIYRQFLLLSFLKPPALQDAVLTEMFYQDSFNLQIFNEARKSNYFLMIQNFLFLEACLWLTTSSFVTCSMAPSILTTNTGMEPLQNFTNGHLQVSFVQLQQCTVAAVYACRWLISKLDSSRKKIC